MSTHNLPLAISLYNVILKEINHIIGRITKIYLEGDHSYFHRTYSLLLLIALVPPNIN